MNLNTEAFIVGTQATIIQAMRQLEETAQKVLFVVDGEQRLIGSLTDGDSAGGGYWRQAACEDPGRQLCNESPYYVGTDYHLEQIRGVMVDRNIGCIPVLDEHGELVELLFWEAVFKDSGKQKPVTPIDLPVVIMAGGKGSRLDPFTRILPKPSFPWGTRPSSNASSIRFSNTAFPPSICRSTTSRKSSSPTLKNCSPHTRLGIFTKTGRWVQLEASAIFAMHSPVPLS